jgi:hypothetical protein
MKNARVAAALAIFCLCAPAVFSQDRSPSPGIAALLPKLAGWSLAEAPRAFFPDDLFEYIDGAAESYLSYDFRELLVADLTKEGTEASLTLEIYDMGLPVNAFGIFAAERYPENKPVALGDLGYSEGEALNFLDGRYYVKMLAFGLGDGTDAALSAVGAKVAAAVKPEGRLPALAAAFPKDGLVARSEKYIKKNFMGYEFLHDGYVATYDSGGRELEGFFVDGGSGQETEAMLAKLLEALKADGQTVDKTADGFHARNRYGQHLYIGRAGSVLCGAMRVPDGLEGAGEKLLRAMVAAASAVHHPRQ